MCVLQSNGFSDKWAVMKTFSALNLIFETFRRFKLLKNPDFEEHIPINEFKMQLK